MFIFHIAFSLSLIALTLGMALHAWAGRNGMGFAQFIGFLVVVFALISTVCTGYYGYLAFKQGPMMPMMGNMQQMRQQMIDQNMKNVNAPEQKKNKKS